MEDLFEVLFVIIVAVIGISSKTKKNKKPAEKKAASPARTPEAKPAQPAKPLDDLQKAVSRENIEAAVKAFTELIDENESLPDPDKPAAVIHGAQRAVKKALTAIEAETRMKQRAEIVQARVAESLSGESRVDNHGCIGGSMPAHNAEGESREEHAAHEHERSRRLAEEALDAGSLRRPGAQDLRRAVVMSEILDKPVALRGRRI